MMAKTHLGKRLQFWMEHNSNNDKGSAIKLCQFMGLKDKRSVYDKRKKSDMSFEEILKLCEWFGLTISEFTGLTAHDFGIEIPKKYIPMEQRIGRIENLIEDFLKSTPK